MDSLQRLASVLSSTSTAARRFVRATQGNVAMMFAIAMPVLIMLAFGGVDIHRATTVRANLQDALDAATLAAARSPHVTDEELRTVALGSLRANLRAFPNIKLREDLLKIHLTEGAVIITDATVDVDTLIANVILPPYGSLMDKTVPVSVHSEVNRSSKNIEVALVLDITGSMGGTDNRIADLKAAADELVDIVVQDVQTPYSTRMAVVPYSSGVNLGSYANAARGTPPAAKSISGAAWTTGSSKAISAITRANPGQVTASSHGFATGDFVWISGVAGMTQINNKAYRVVRIDSGKFSLQRWNGTAWAAVNTSSGYSSYSSNGIARKCLVSDCSVVVTANNHGLGDGDGAYIDGVAGMTQINKTGFEIANVTTNTFSIGVNGAGWGNYASGGTVVCGYAGCAARVFRNPSGAIRGLPISSCVSERPGPNAHNDASPTLSKVGRNYPTTERDGDDKLINPCPDAVLQPLTSNRATLKSLISGLPAIGSTAGQIGIAWGWYAISPNFNSLWGGASSTGSYDPKATIKAVIIMTDGEFNTPYNSGVIARNAGTGSGGNDRKINENGTDPYVESDALCDAMKAQNVTVYTVGFKIASGGNAARLMRDCATSQDHFYLPESGGDLSEAFAAIGRDITRLRISK